MKTIETYIVDSFTNQPFKGNPAGVCLLKEALPEAKMQSIAKELGLSETAFVVDGSNDHEFGIRFFSPKMEIPLCGHATLAASKIIFQKNENQNNITFINVENLKLPIQNSDEHITMHFPVYNTFPQEAPKELINALGLEEIINSEFNKEYKILLLEIENCEELKKLSPNFSKLVASHNSINGVLVTAKSQQPNYDFESRYFWPWSGTNEDPVTGATHTFLAKYWSTRLNKTMMNAFQCSERSGFMEVELISESKMTIKSKAQIVFKGELMV